jgi:hypothetical protein
MAKYSRKKSLSQESVLTFANLDAIPDSGIDIGTIAWITSEDAFYILKTANSGWKKIYENSYYAGAPTYTLIKSPIGGAVDEGDTMTVTITTTGVSDGTSVGYLWEGISNSDVTGGPFQGTAVIYNSIATVTLVAKADFTTDGVDIATFSLDATDSLGNATNATSAEFTISDTSIDPVGNTNPDFTINVTASGASAYTMTGTDRNGVVSGQNPTLLFYVDDIVDFVINSPGHPFFLKTVANNGTGNTITINGSEIPNNGTSNGTIRWTVHTDDTFYYICQFHGAMSAPIITTPAVGGILYDIPGTYTWTAPVGITSVSAVVIGGGGAADFSLYGGEGGALAWKNSIPVIPGEDYTVSVGNGATTSSEGRPVIQSGSSYFISSATVSAKGGDSGSNATSRTGTEVVGDGGGAGGHGGQGGGYVTGSKSGGGAGGYSGNGGNAGSHTGVSSNTTLDAGDAGSGGGGGGGGHYSSGDINFTGTIPTTGGGGVGVYGQGANGAGGAATSATTLFAGKGGSGGDDGTRGGINSQQANGGDYGGGAGVVYKRDAGAANYVPSYPGLENTTAGKGAVRIIWGSGRAFPSTNVALADSNGYETTYVPPAVPTYTATPTTFSVSEGSSVTINVATTAVPNATTLYWTVTRASEFNVSSGSFTISNNAGQFTVTPIIDAVVENPETFQVQIRTVSTSGTVVDTTSAITINNVNVSANIVSVSTMNLPSGFRRTSSPKKFSNLSFASNGTQSSGPQFSLQSQYGVQTQITVEMWVNPVMRGDTIFGVSDPANSMYHGVDYMSNSACQWRYRAASGSPSGSIGSSAGTLALNTWGLLTAELSTSSNGSMVARWWLNATGNGGTWTWQNNAPGHISSFGAITFAWWPYAPNRFNGVFGPVRVSKGLIYNGSPTVPTSTFQTTADTLLIIQ